MRRSEYSFAGSQHWLSFVGLCEKRAHPEMGMEYSFIHSASWLILVLRKYPGRVFQFHCPRHRRQRRNGIIFSEQHLIHCILARQYRHLAAWDRPDFQTAIQASCLFYHGSSQQLFNGFYRNIPYLAVSYRSYPFYIVVKGNVLWQREIQKN